MHLSTQGRCRTPDPVLATKCQHTEKFIPFPALRCREPLPLPAGLESEHARGQGPSDRLRHDLVKLRYAWLVISMNKRQFAVRVAARIDRRHPAPLDLVTEASTLPTEELGVELVAGGLEELVIVPDAEGDGLTIRGLSPGDRPEDARAWVEGQIYDATLDLVILEPGVWIDDAIHL